MDDKHQAVVTAGDTAVVFGCPCVTGPAPCDDVRGGSLVSKVGVGGSVSQ